MKFRSLLIAAMASTPMLLGLAACNDSSNSSQHSATATPAAPAGNASGTAPSPSSSAAPALSGTPASSVKVGQRFAFTPITTGGAASVKYSIIRKPAWLAFDASNGALSGTPAAKDVGDYKAMVLSVTSEGKTSSLPAFDVTVNPALSQPANLSWLAPTSSTNGGALYLSGYHIYYGASATSLVNVVSVSAAETSYVFANLKPGVWYFAVAAINSDNVESAMSAVVPADI